jgi:hypothetical protein
MASSGKKKTTMAKLARESRLRERRQIKQAKKEARKQASRDGTDLPGSTLDATTAEAAQPGSGEVPLEPAVQPLAETD